nr:hypothetical protein CFP56_19413 [Quercus suber]
MSVRATVFMAMMNTICVVVDLARDTVDCSCLVNEPGAVVWYLWYLVAVGPTYDKNVEAAMSGFGRVKPHVSACHGSFTCQTPAPRGAGMRCLFSTLHHLVSTPNEQYHPSMPSLLLLCYPTPAPTPIPSPSPHRRPRPLPLPQQAPPGKSAREAETCHGRMHSSHGTAQPAAV